ncbi:MAG: tRNA threonylcarbamoyladenosine dehydratase [Eubacteriales bacterium]
MEQFIRTQMIIGVEGLQTLQDSHVIIFGIGGVGGYVAEGLARSGVGTITLVDHDTVAESNLNRQIIALHSTLGRSKVECMKERILDINPNCVVEEKPLFYLPDTEGDFYFSTCDYIVDAIDTVTAKIALVVRARQENIPIISSMGTGNKRFPAMLEVSDLSKTSVCPLAKVMRKELKTRGITSLKVVYSKEIPQKQPVVAEGGEVCKKRVKATPGSLAFVPSVAGMILASEVVHDLLNKKEPI